MIEGIAITLIIEAVVGIWACARYRVRLRYTPRPWPLGED